MECEFMCDDGISRRLDIAAGATAPFNCVYQNRLRTPKGDGAVLGECAGSLYVLLDSNAASLVATPFTKDDFDAGLLELLPDAHVVVDPLDSHRVKRDVFCGRSVGIVTQDQNGPCPLLALANALALQGKVDLCPDGCRRVEAQQLRRIILEYITQNEPPVPRFECPATRIVDSAEVKTIAGLVQERLVEARASLAEGVAGEEFLYRLYQGLNISPIFSFMDGFDAEDDVLLFALAGLRVVHGWLIPPDSRYAALRGMSFNEVSLFATNKDSELTALANDFLENTRSQLTVEGLDMLRAELSEGEIVVLFWNNHFSTAVKLGGRLLLLLSDETYADRSSILFEAIEDVHGGSTFTDGSGVNTDTFLLAVQFLTGNEFTPEAVAAAKSSLEEQDSEKPLPETVVSYLRGQNRKEESIDSYEKESTWPLWVRENADTLMGMGFNIEYTEACELLQKCGSVSAAVGELCQEPPNS